MAIDVQKCKDEAWAILKPKVEGRIHPDSTVEDKNKILAMNREISDSVVEAVLKHVLNNAEVELLDWVKNLFVGIVSAAPVPMDGGAAFKTQIVNTAQSKQISKKIK